MKYLISPKGERKIDTLGFTIPKIYREVNDFGGHQSLATTKIVRTKKGFSIHRFSTYVTIERIRIEVFKNGTMKGRGIREKNYQPKLHFTEYFDSEGNQISLKEFKSIK